MAATKKSTSAPASTAQQKKEEAKKLLTAAAQYKETVTDADKQYYRDLLLDLNKGDKTIQEL